MAWNYAGVSSMTMDVSLSSSGDRVQSKSTLHSYRAPGTPWPDCVGFAAQGTTLGKRILPMYFFSFWWFHRDVSLAPLACKDMEHLLAVVVRVVQHKQDRVHGKRAQLKEVTCIFPLYQWLCLRNPPFEGPQQFPEGGCNHVACCCLGTFRQWLLV